MDRLKIEVTGELTNHPTQEIGWFKSGSKPVMVNFTAKTVSHDGHIFGLSSYSVTDKGGILFVYNLLDHE